MQFVAIIVYYCYINNSDFTRFDLCSKVRHTMCFIELIVHHALCLGNMGFSFRNVVHVCPPTGNLTLGFCEMLSLYNSFTKMWLYHGTVIASDIKYYSITVL